MPPEITVQPPKQVRAVLLGVMALGLAGVAVTAIRSTGGLGGLGHPFSDYVYPLVFLPPAILCFARAGLVAGERLAWACFGTAFLLWGAAFAYYGVSVHHAGMPPFPSLADALWLSMYPFVYAGLVLLLKARSARFRGSLWVDGLIGGLALAALGASILVDPVLEATDDDAFAAAVTLAYPLADLALLVVVLIVGTASGWRLGREWLLIGGALLIAVITDGLYVRHSVAGGWDTGTLLDAGWAMAAMMIASAAWLRPRVRARVDLDEWRVLPVPAGFTAGALAILVVGNFYDLGPTPAWLAAGALLAALVRAALSVREKQRLGEVARRDALTGLLNHGAFHEAVDEEIERRNDTQEAFAVVMLDLDGFRQVNDLRGHAEGDRLLRSVSKTIARTLRSEDIVGRIGGDEFGVLLPGKDAAGATAVAERIRARIREHDLDIDLSYGVGEWPGDGPSKALVLLRADTALYAAKADRAVEAGRAGEEESPTKLRRGDIQRRREAEAELELERAQLRSYAKDLRNSYARELGRSQELKQSYLATVRTLAAAVEAKDEYTGGHIQRVHALGLLLAREAAPRDAGDAQLSYGFLLHDVGKLAISDDVLNKPGKLSEEEWELVKRHPEHGVAILSGIPFLGPALEVVRHHHERWDGTGYPDRLRGPEIPHWARMFAIVDTVDAITSDRPYREGRPLEVAIEVLRENAGSQFDPDCVELFANLDRSEVEPLLQHRGVPVPLLTDLALPEYDLGRPGG